MLGTPTRITELIMSYDKGEITLDSLVRQLAAYSYNDPKKVYTPQDDDPPEGEYGTWDEVRNARNVGQLSPDEYLQIVRAADERHPTVASR